VNGGSAATPIRIIAVESGIAPGDVAIEFQAMTSHLPRARRSSRLGFTLVELMVVVLLISVLTMLAVPGIKRVQTRAKTAVIVSDLRTFAAAFDTYAQENGSWPAETAAGVLPVEMTGHLNETAWLRTTPMGGKYNWENKQLHFGVRNQAAIAISATASAPLVLDVNQLYDIERELDGNNDLLTGTFRIGSGLNPLFIVQP
jgi:prepilin-type N-terminal cleavage/methylation domain-containing protein